MMADVPKFWSADLGRVPDWMRIGMEAQRLGDQIAPAIAQHMPPPEWLAAVQSQDDAILGTLRQAIAAGLTRDDYDNLRREIAALRETVQGAHASDIEQRRRIVEIENLVRRLVDFVDPPTQQD